MNFKAGTYYVGDPCYVFSYDREDGWDKLLLDTNFFKDIPPHLEGKIWAAGTKWGDGCYEDQHGWQYPVDAGLIGVVHESLLQEYRSRDGRMVEFKEDFSTDVDEDMGMIYIGDIEINTDPSYDEDDWYDED